MSISVSQLHATHFPYARWRLLPLDAISLTAGFWAQWQSINRRTTLPHGYEMLEKAGNFHNFRVAAGLTEGRYQGPVFMDSDVYKWLEAAAYELHLHPNTGLQQQAAEVIALIGAAQQSDGYINTHYQVVEHGQRWIDLDFGHELYCAGHLFQAAAAHYRATHSTHLLDIATRFADLLCNTFGPDKRQGACGHPEIEMALVELYRVTRRSAYLELAKYFIDQRGKGVMRGMDWIKSEYHQDRVPVRQASEVEGHAVRAMYLNAGVTDLYLETGDEALLAAMQRQWLDMVTSKLFLTGGLGARYEGESFGAPYELPADRCYCETCAAIGSVLWNWRMLLVTGEGRFADLIERQLYNGVLSGLALDGKNFFYMNPLLSRGGYSRQPWYTVACCPPNIMRLLASLAQYLATQDEAGLQIHLYNSATIRAPSRAGQPIVLQMQTDYPWQGQVQLVVQATDGSTWQLRLRVPEWCLQASVTINGQSIESPRLEAGYLVVERVWQPGDVISLRLPMEPMLVAAHPRIDAIRGSLAIQRGPLVYCLEATDHPDANLMDIRLDETAVLYTDWREDVLPGGLMVVQTLGFLAETADWLQGLYRRFNGDGGPRQSIPLLAVPYYAWANRGANAMRVWIPRAKAG